jgi:glycerol-3-phosphate dehydrogenase
MQKIASADIIIFGGGIAGLWLLNRLRKEGFSVFLFESGSLGGGQTYKAQGIIHGGMKYALQGEMTAEVRAIADMPTVWRKCLAGEGEIDLSHVHVLSPCHYLWAPHKLTSKLAGFFAGAALTSKVEPVNKKHYPTVFQSPDFKGEVFALDEIVVDVPGLVRELVKANQDVIFKMDALQESDLVFDQVGQLTEVHIRGLEQLVTLRAQRFIFAAGAGNEIVLNKMRTPTFSMQRRPLHMVLAKTPFTHRLYAHCMGLGTKPRLTVTSHSAQDGSVIWYLGGQLAEEGVTRSSEEQITAARQELRALFPWLDFSAVHFATFHIDRAEPWQKSGMKPNTVFAKEIQNTLITWPTKLTLAPQLADEVMQCLRRQQLKPHLLDVHELLSWPMPPLAKPVWEEMFCLNVS